MYSVLYVDDEQTLLELGRIFLERSGLLKIDTALSAAEAIKKLEGDVEGKAYNGIISDYLMPEMDGITFLKYVRSHWGQLPFILFTGKGREDVVIEALNSGADFYLQKGGNPQAQFVELEHKINLAIERRGTEKALKESQQKLAETNITLQEDIAERRTMEAALSESEKRLQGIVHGSPIPQFVLDKDHRVISWNEALEEYSGVRAQDVLGTTDAWRAFYENKRPVMADLLVDGTLEKIPEWYAGKYRPSKYVEGAYEATDFFPRMGAGGIWLYFTASAIRDPDGNIIGAVETLQDITDHKRVEDALRESGQKVRGLLDQTFQFIGLMTLDGTLIEANRTALEFSGIRESDVIGRPFWEAPWWTHSPELQEQLREAVRRAAQGEFERFEATHPAADGSLHYIDFSLKPVKDDAGNVAFLIPEGRDITDLKHADERAQHYQFEMSRAIDYLPDPTFVIDRNGTVIAWNRAIEAMTGVSAENIIGKGDYEYALPFYGRRRPILINLLFASDEELKKGDYVEIKRTGEILSVETQNPIIKGKPAIVRAIAAPIYDESGNVAGAIETITDITELKQAQEDLRVSENRYRTIFENTGAATVLLEENTIISIANAEYIRMSGYSKEEVEGKKSWTEFVVKEDLERMLAQHRMRREKHEAALRHYEFRFVTKSGDIRNIFLTIDVIPGTKQSIASLMDITAQIRAQDAVILANKKLNLLYSITRHDINNQLTCLMGFLELVEKDT